jgi:hypothetical protein
LPLYERRFSITDNPTSEPFLGVLFNHVEAIKWQQYSPDLEHVWPRPKEEATWMRF